MSAFVDATLLRFAQDAFVSDLLTNGLGLAAIFNATFDATDIQLQSVTLGPITARSYKVPAFESVRISGTDERIVPDTQRVRKEYLAPRFGRLDWVVDGGENPRIDGAVVSLAAFFPPRR